MLEKPDYLLVFFLSLILVVSLTAITPFTFADDDDEDDDDNDDDKKGPKTLESECAKKKPTSFDGLFCIAIFLLQQAIADLQGQIDAIENLQIEVITVDGNLVDLNFGRTNQDTSVASCPSTHKVIGGGLREFNIKFPTQGIGQKVDYEISQETNFANNSYEVDATLKDQADRFLLKAYANCAKIVS